MLCNLHSNLVIFKFSHNNRLKNEESNLHSNLVIFKFKEDGFRFDLIKQFTFQSGDIQIHPIRSTVSEKS